MLPGSAGSLLCTFAAAAADVAAGCSADVAVRSALLAVERLILRSLDCFDLSTGAPAL